MAEKSLDEQIADHDAEIKKLEAKKEELRVKALPQYPKAIQVPAPEPAKDAPKTVTIVVNSEAEEKAAIANHKAKAHEPVKVGR